MFKRSELPDGLDWRVLKAKWGSLLQGGRSAHTRSPDWWGGNRVVCPKSVINLLVPAGLGPRAGGQQAVIFSTCQGFYCLQNSSRTWLRIMSTALEEELKALGFVFGINYYYFILLGCFPLFLHFLTWLNLLFGTQGRPQTLKFFYKQEEGAGWSPSRHGWNTEGKVAGVDALSWGFTGRRWRGRAGPAGAQRQARKRWTALPPERVGRHTTLAGTHHRWTLSLE